jgi:diketogulonate reductase-like aldo/keto reductase
MQKVHSRMVQVRNKTRNKNDLNFIKDMTNRHGFHIMLFLFLVLTYVGYLKLHSQEERMLQIQSGIAAAHSANFQRHKPHLIYGTAWKKEKTAHYVSEAVKAGFRFIDTACQPKHYNEAGVGNGWMVASKELNLERSDMWLQTKYTPFGGQDAENCPYDPNDPIETQVLVSLETSLKNLRTDYLDSWVMHSPLNTLEDTMVAWRTMESAVDSGKVRQLGMSNCYSLEFFKDLYEQAHHKPAVLQNRFYADSAFDTELRKFCKEHDIHYQSFWTLGANRGALRHSSVAKAAESFGLTPETYMFAFLMSLGYVNPLSGTTSQIHMAEDVAIMERMQGGETFFHNEEELREFAQILGMPDL